MATTPIYALRYPGLSDPADVPTDMENLAVDVENVLGGTLAASPPASPRDGQIWSLPVGNGVVWQFRYNAGSASPYKWESIGAAPATSFVAAAQTIGSATTWTPGGPTFAIPRPGDYVLTFSSTFTISTIQQLYVSAWINGAQETSFVAGAAPQIGDATLGRAQVQKTIVTTQTIQLAYWVQIAGVQVTNRWLAVTPVRVS